jgi:hypothetical protein
MSEQTNERKSMSEQTMRATGADFEDSPGQWEAEAIEELERSSEVLVWLNAALASTAENKIIAEQCRKGTGGRVHCCAENAGQKVTRYLLEQASQAAERARVDWADYSRNGNSQSEKTALLLAIIREIDVAKVQNNGPLGGGAATGARRFFTYWSLERAVHLAAFLYRGNAQAIGSRGSAGYSPLRKTTNTGGYIVRSQT